jgi:hypothetical protein
MLLVVVMGRQMMYPLMLLVDLVVLVEVVV